MNLIHHMWSGNHPAVVKEIDLMTLLWTDGERHLPCTYQIYNKPNDGKTKNNHFEDLIDPAKAGEFQPEYAIFDGWYSSLANGRPIQSDDTMADKTQANRRVNPNRARKRPVGDCDIAGNRYNSLS